MEVSCLMSSTLTLTLKQHSFKKKTNPNPNHTFYWHPFEFIHFLMHTHPTQLPIPTLFLSILLFDAFENVYYFLLHIIMSAAISICHFNCVCLEKYCHLGEGTFHFLSAPSPLPPFPSLPPSLRVSFWKVGLRCNLDPSDISFKIKVMHQVLTKNLGFRPQPCLRKGWRGMDTNPNPK